MYISATSIDNALGSIQLENAKRYGISASERMLYPLVWYVNTGRASLAFLHALIEAKPYLIARDLAKGGSDEDVIDRVCKRIGYHTTF